MKSENHKHFHKKNAVVGQTRMSELNSKVTSGALPQGITKTYIAQFIKAGHLNYELKSPGRSSNAKEVYEAVLGPQARQYMKDLKTLKSIQDANKEIWEKYKAATSFSA